MSSGKGRNPPTLEQIRRDEQTQFRQVLSDEKIREILKTNDALDWSKWTRPILQLLSKHDWLPMKLLGQAIGASHASIHSATLSLRRKKLIETKYQMYHHVNTALWLKITPEGRRTIQPNKKHKDT